MDAEMRERPNRHLSTGEKLWRVNWSLLAVVTTVACIGIASLYSVAGGSTTPWAEQHAIRLLVGLALIIAMAVVPMRLWIGLAYPTYIAAFVLLVLVMLVGTEAMGARRWLRFGGFSVQPSEIMKVALVATLARYYLWLPEARLSRPLWVLIPTLAILAPVALVLKQPDLGTAVLFAVVGFGMMLLAGVNILYFLGGAVTVGGLTPLIWANLHDYQKRRIATFLDPEADPQGAGYHIMQSKIALGSGGFSGKGYMQGTQSALDFLPEKQTDFIFTMFGEEMGFVGAMVLIALYVMMIAIMLAMAFAGRNPFSRLVVAGAALIIFVYAFVNMAMVTGLVPVVGVPLPFMSYGGTAMLTAMVALGVAMCGFVNRSERIRRDEIGAFI